LGRVHGHILLFEKIKKQIINKMQMNKKKRIIREGCNEAKSHSVKPIKVCTFYFVKHIRVLADYC
jgi:hypothetical protein